MAYKAGKCWACHNRRPVDSHHLTPLNYGGKRDGPQVDLCGSCHNTAHLEAEHYYKFGKFQELDVTVPYQKDGFGERIRIIIANIIKARQAFEAGLTEVSEQRRMTQISWSSDAELQMAHDVKTRMKFKSLERAIKHLVFEKWHDLNRR